MRSRKQATILAASLAAVSMFTGAPARASRSASSILKPADARALIEQTNRSQVGLARAADGAYRMRPKAERLQEVVARHGTSPAALRNARTYAAISRDLAATRRGTPIPDVRAILLERARTAAAATASEGNTLVHYGLPAGDFDGDGRADVIDFELTVGPELDVLGTVVTPRNGASGAALWSRPIDGIDFFPVEAGDLDGDGADDLVIIELFDGDAISDGACAEVVCADAGHVAFNWLVDVRSGATGALMWSRSLDASVSWTTVDETAPTPTFNSDGVALVRNAFVDVLPAGDQNGDGRDDLLMQTLSGVEAFGWHDAYVDAAAGDAWIWASAGAYAQVVASATTISVVAGTTGDPLFERQTPMQPAIVLAGMVGDLAGDPARDVLIQSAFGTVLVSPCAAALETFACMAPGAYRLRAELVAGRTFSSVWSAQHAVDGADGFYVDAGDVNDDGGRDLILYEFSESIASVVVSGATGAVLWRAKEIVLGPIGTPEDGQEPIVISIGQLDDPGEAFAFTVRRLDGRDGGFLRETEHRVEPLANSPFIFIVIELYLVPSANDDVYRDAVVQVFVFGHDTTSSLVVESGPTGDRLLDRTVDRLLIGIPSEDTNGDGTSDLLDLEPVFHRESLDLTLTGRSLPSGAGSWTRVDRLFYASDLAFGIGGDLSGAGGADLVLNMLQLNQDGTLEAITDAVEQRDGSTLWRLGTSWTDPPLPGTASISGHITAGGEAFGMGCVEILTADGDSLGYDLAGPDGAYIARELRANTYKLQFHDCGFGEFASEWYDDAEDFESATVVTLSDGEALSGIDADLAPFVFE